MITAPLLLLSLLAVVGAFDIGPIRPLPPLDPIWNWPPWTPPRPCNCATVHCPIGYHCEMLQHVNICRPPCFFPKEPTCVPNGG